MVVRMRTGGQELANKPFVVVFESKQELHRKVAWVVINELVMDWAEQHKVRICVDIIN